MYELAINFYSSPKPINNSVLKEISKIYFDGNKIKIGNIERKIRYIISDLTLYGVYEYNSDEMSIKRLDIDKRDIERIIKSDRDKELEVDMNINIPSGPSIDI